MEFELPDRWRAALDIVQMDFPDAVIAGGALRDLILGREVKDIDIFACHPQRWADPARRWTWVDICNWADRYLGGTSRCVINEGFADYCESMDSVVCAIEIDANILRPMPIQLITMNVPVTLQSAVERIDFGLCRVAHDGKELFIHPDFEHDRANECFTVRRCNNEAQLERSRQRHARLQAKYPGWPMRIPAGTVALHSFSRRAGDNKFGFTSCPFCKAAPYSFEFKDKLSAHEYEISGLCQSCQDGFFTT